MNKLVYSIWILLTIAITILTIFCIFNPAWYIHNNHIHSFGLTVFCEGLSTEDQQIQSRCETYGGTFGLANIPSGAWQASFLLISTGAFSFGVTVILGILIHCIRERYVYSISSLVLYLQTSAGKSCNMICRFKKQIGMINITIVDKLVYISNYYALILPLFFFMFIVILQKRIFMFLFNHIILFFSHFSRLICSEQIIGIYQTS